MTNEFNQQKQTIISSLRAHRLNAALRQLRTLAESNSARDIAEKATAIESDYALMLKYLVEGANDPDRQKMYNKFISRTHRLIDQITRRHNITETGSLYYSILRFEATRPNDNVASLIGKYFQLLDSSSLFNLISAENDTEGNTHRNLEQQEITERRIFNRLWVTFPLESDNAESVEKLIKADEIPCHMKQLAISSLLMGLLEFYDEKRLEILIDTYITNASKQNSPLAPEALTAIAITLFRYSDRPIAEKISILLEQASQLPTWTSDLKNVYTELVKTRDTERINRKMTDEVIPELIKMRPDIVKKNIDISEISDLSDIEENPEWLEMLEKSGITERLKEMTEIQEEGGDVFMSTFAHLKRFPFFNEIANWFMPFHTEHTAIDSTDESASTIATVLTASPFLCDSDKFSFFFSILQVPEQQRQLMMSQFKNFNISNAELRSAALNPSAVDRSNTINKYIQDLYRFFRLFSRKEEFDDPFRTRMNIFKVPGLAKLFNDTTTHRTIAEFYFKHKYFAEALEMFRAIEQTEPPTPQIYQKIGFCYQKAGELENALDYYQRSELLDARSQWTLKRIASCLTILGRHSEALDYYNRILGQSPDNVRTIVDTAVTMVELKRFKDAIPMFHKAIYLDPSNSRAQRNLAHCLIMTHDLKSAEKQLNKLIISNATTNDYINLGHIAVARNDIKEAVRFYRLAAEKSGTTINDTVNRLLRDIPYMENAGIDTSSLPFIIDALDC